MGNRLSKIYTKTGDSGKTAVANGERILKSSPRIQALGALDHLNAQIGLLVCEELPSLVKQRLNQVQHILFDIGGELAMPELQSVAPDMVARLEQEIDTMNQKLPALQEFILPGGSREAAMCHLARTQCRLAESACVNLNQAEPEQALRHEALSFINRLSDWLFVAARYTIAWQDKVEILWQNPYSRKK